jgi:hypothetical protein
MVVKSVSLVELKKQQWAKEKGKLFLIRFGQFHLFSKVSLLVTTVLCVSEELVRLNGYWKNPKTPIVFNDQRYNDQFLC